MKKHIFAVALLGSVSSIAFAADIAITPNNQIQACAGTGTQNQVGGVTGTPISDAGTFIRTAFGITCSNNSLVFFTNGANSDPTLFTVGAASVKGNQSVKGSSSSGGVSVHAACNPTCTEDLAKEAEAQAVTDATSS